MSTQRVPVDLRSDVYAPVSVSEHGNGNGNGHTKGMNGHGRNSGLRHPSAVIPRHPLYLHLKGAADFAFALLLLVPALPILLVAAAWIKCTSRGPVFYTQTRVGRYGREFKLIKLRTMVDKAEALTGPVWSQADDPRVTPVGRFLRNTHIDEFPQLLNVLRGQMSLIGPRPERPEIIERLEWDIPEYRERLRVRPGVTGLAQLKLPPDSGIESVRRKLIHDLYYVRHVSAWLDLKLFAFTAAYLGLSLLRSVWRVFDLPSREHVTDKVEAIVEPGSSLFEKVEWPAP